MENLLSNAISACDRGARADAVRGARLILEHAKMDPLDAGSRELSRPRGRDARRRDAGQAPRLMSA
jgi:hypothetical protein